MTSFPTSCSRALLEHVRTHEQVRVPVAAGVGAVRADAADLGGEVEDELGARVGEQPRRVVQRGEVVVAAPGDERRRGRRLEPLDEVRAEEAAAAGDEDSRSRLAGASAVASQSTRPIQRSRFAAYQLDRAQDALLPRDQRLPAGLAVQLLVADAERHHVGDAWAQPCRRRHDLPVVGPVAVLVGRRAGSTRPSRPSRCSFPGRRRRRRREPRARRR